MNETTRPTIDERYTSATNTSDLTMDVQASGTPPAAILIAAGWSRSRLGAALQRLHSEWDGSEKPAKPGSISIEALAATLPMPFLPLAGDDRSLRKANTKARLLKAQRMAEAWYIHELGLLFQKLKTLPEVRQRLEFWARAYGMRDASSKVAAVLSFWLDSTCRACGGSRWEVIPGTTRHSNRACKECAGLGELELPCGLEGRRIEAEIIAAVRASVDSMRGHLHARRTPAPQNSGQGA